MFVGVNMSVIFKLTSEEQARQTARINKWREERKILKAAVNPPKNKKEAKRLKSLANLILYR